jgi:hypothetical protein
MEKPLKITTTTHYHSIQSSLHTEWNVTDMTHCNSFIISNASVITYLKVQWDESRSGGINLNIVPYQQVKTLLAGSTTRYLAVHSMQMTFQTLKQFPQVVSKESGRVSPGYWETQAIVDPNQRTLLTLIFWWSVVHFGTDILCSMHCKEKPKSYLNHPELTEM